MQSFGQMKPDSDRGSWFFWANTHGNLLDRIAIGLSAFAHVGGNQDDVDDLDKDRIPPFKGNNPIGRLIKA